jgi:hypothetical protein
LGQEQHNLAPPISQRSSGLPLRSCLRKGCTRTFQPQRWNQRYCQDRDCLRLVRRWQAAKRQRQRRCRPEVRQQRAAATRQQRAHRREQQLAGTGGQETTAAGSRKTERAWSRSTNNFKPFCDRPGCYEPRRPSRGGVACYCGADCRQAMRRIRDRECKWLRRKTAVGRFKRRLEYQARRAAQRGDGPASQRSSATACSAPVGGYEPPNQAALPCGERKESPSHDPQTPARSRPRAPPSS